MTWNGNTMVVLGAEEYVPSPDHTELKTFFPKVVSLGHVHHHIPTDKFMNRKSLLGNQYSF
jgi:hypothetical protein